MHIYVEQLLFENLIINYVILYASKVFLKSETSIIRLILSAFIGAMYTLVVFIPSTVFMVKIITKIIVAIVLIQVGFKPKSIRMFIRTIATFHLIAFTFAGVCLALLYTTQIDTYISGGIFYIDNFKIKKLVIAIISALMLIQLTVEYIKNKNMKIKNLISFKIRFKNKEVDVKGMMDTGNSLKDPINKLPVIVVELMAIKELFPDGIQKMFNKYSENNMELFTNIICNSPDEFKFRLIPFKSLGNQEGMLLGFKPDCVILETEEKLEVKELVIAIYNEKLSNDDEYNALLHLDIIT